VFIHCKSFDGLVIQVEDKELYRKEHYLLGHTKKKKKKKNKTKKKKKKKKKSSEKNKDTRAII
jgi:hypothetical protein